MGWYCGETKRRAGDESPVRVVIGKDTRRSSYMFEYALASGLVASGADAYLLHVTTTPSVSYVARTEGFDCGIMISASHNPFYDNGIKLIGRSGEKMDEDTIALIEDYLDGRLELFGQKWPALPLARQGSTSAARWTMWRGATATWATSSPWGCSPSRGRRWAWTVPTAARG